MDECLSILLAIKGVEHCHCIGSTSGDMITFDDIPDAPNNAFEQLKTFLFETEPDDFVRMNRFVANILLGAPNMESFAFLYTAYPGDGLPFYDNIPHHAIHSLSVMPLRSLTLLGPAPLPREQ